MSPSRARLGVFALLFVLPFTTGCVKRMAPFNQLDDASVTLYRLQEQQTAQTTTRPGLPMFPGVPPELQNMGRQIITGWQQTLPPNLIPPGLIPGLPGQTTTQPTQTKLFRQRYTIVAEQPVMDDSLKQDLLDIFGDSSSFQADRGNCFFAGFGVSFASPTQMEPVDVVVSFSCNRAVGFGFTWPHTVDGLTSETYTALSNIYQSMWGPIPAGA